MTETGTLGGPDGLTDRERAAVEAELFALADDEFVLAERYTEWQVRGPTLEADVAIANIAQDELGHARLWYDLLEAFGYDQVDLLWEREPADFTHTTLVERPFDEGDWADCVVRGYLYDVAEHLRLESLADSSYPPIAGRIDKVRGEEHYHREHAQNWLERLCADEEGRSRVQAAIDRLFPHALTLFESTAHEDEIVDLGIRSEPCSALRGEWRAIIEPFLAGLGVDPPLGDAQELLPGTRGRDGSHTDVWTSLYEEFTHTYRHLEREEAPSLMPDPEEADI